jgi:hypothetical protein
VEVEGQQGGGGHKDYNAVGFYFSAVTCIATTMAPEQKEHLILAGRADGSLDLFSSITSVALMTWSLETYIKKPSSKAMHCNYELSLLITIICALAFFLTVNIYDSEQCRLCKMDLWT